MRDYKPAHLWRTLTLFIVGFWLLAFTLMASAQTTIPVVLNIKWINPVATKDDKPFTDTTKITSIRVFVSPASIPDAVDTNTAFKVSRPTDAGGLISGTTYTQPLAPGAKIFVRVAACNAPTPTSIRCSLSNEVSYTHVVNVELPQAPGNVTVTFTATVATP